VEDLVNEEEEEEEEEEDIILHLCHDRKKATHKTKNSKICCQFFPVTLPFPFLFLSFPFLLSLSAKKPKLSTVFL